jgi:hypothetical protein
MHLFRTSFSSETRIVLASFAGSTDLRRNQTSGMAGMAKSSKTTNA